MRTVIAVGFYFLCCWGAVSLGLEITRVIRTAISRRANVAIIEKLKETRRYAKLLKAAERVDKHLTLDWLIDDTYVSLVDEQYGEKSELRESVIALIEALPEKEGK